MLAGDISPGWGHQPRLLQRVEEAAGGNNLLLCKLGVNCYVLALLWKDEEHAMVRFPLGVLKSFMNQLNTSRSPWLVACKAG